MAALSAPKRQRLSLAHAYDLDARLGVVTVEVRGRSLHEQVLRGVGAGVLSSAVLELALSVARRLSLQNIELLSCDCIKELPPEVIAEFGGVRLRKVPARKNQAARRRAHRLLRELVPLRRPAEEDGLAEWGIELEIARLGGLTE